jgi:ATP adenylyltransferase
VPEFSENIWSPWRMEYIGGLDGTRGEPGCFLCRYAGGPQDDAANHVLWRSPRVLVLLNRFPYTNGHLLVAPLEHVGRFEDVPDDVHFEMIQRICDAKRLLQQVVAAQGFNVGVNLGPCAGAGLPDHVHWHIVPRWVGDTSYMAAVGSVRLIPQALDTLYAKLRETATALNLPRPAE